MVSIPGIVRDITRWSDPAKVLLLSALALPAAFMWFLRLLSVAQQPEASTYVSRAFIPTMLVFTGTQAFGHLGLMLAAAMLRFRSRVTWLVHAEVQFWFACTAFSLYALGPFTSSMSVMLLVLPVVGFLLFDDRSMFAGLATGTVGLILGIALPLLGLAPYAPFLAHAPYAAGHLDPMWIVSQGVPALAATGAGLVVFTTLLRQLRVRQRELELLSSTDTLTGLANRRHFFERLDVELAQADRHGHALSVLMLDIDRFKTINDTHGHAAGDAVLHRLGALLRLELRLPDVPARIGGAEFGVLLPTSALEGAAIVARRLVAAAHRIEFPGGHLTLSVGVAQRRGGEASDSLISRADRALYRAKEAGRDRACSDDLAIPP